jgi:hypothetical protein
MDVDFVQGRALWHVGAPARAQVIEHRHLVASRKAGFCDVGPDEAGATGQGNPHARTTVRGP